MEPVKLLATLFPLALASGVNLYATVLVAGFSIRMGWIQNPPSGLEIFATTPVLIITAIFYLLEFFADKIQIVDTIWDTIHTIIRPLGISILALAALYEFDPFVSVIAALAAGSVSFVSHAAKAGTRFSLNVVSPAENVKNIGISLIEDIFVGLFSFFALKYPYVTALVALILLIFLIVFLPILFRWLFFTFSAVIFRFSSFFSQKKENDIVKGEFMAMLSHPEIKISVKCKSQGVPKARGKSGVLILTQDSLAFAYSKYFGLLKRIWSLKFNEIQAAYFRKRILVDLIEIHYLNDKKKSKISKFIATKNMSLMLKEIESFINKNIKEPNIEAKD